MMTYTVSGILDPGNTIFLNTSALINPRHTLLYPGKSSAVLNVPCPSLPPELKSCLSFSLGMPYLLLHIPKSNPFFKDQLKKLLTDLGHNEEILYTPFKTSYPFWQWIPPYLASLNSFTHLRIISSRKEEILGQHQFWHFTHFILCRTEQSALQLIKS